MFPWDSWEGDRKESEGRRELKILGYRSVRDFLSLCCLTVCIKAAGEGNSGPMRGEVTWV